MTEQRRDRDSFRKTVFRHDWDTITDDERERRLLAWSQDASSSRQEIEDDGQ